MTNEIFGLLTEEEKQTKLKAVLNTKADGRLTEEELRDILMAVSANRQYSVVVCQDSKVFDSLLTLTGSWRGRTVFGQALIGTTDYPGKLFCMDEAAAVVLSDSSNTDAARMLYIYIPQSRFQKGTVNHG